MDPVSAARARRASSTSTSPAATTGTSRPDSTRQGARRGASSPPCTAADGAGRPRSGHRKTGCGRTNDRRRARPPPTPAVLSLGWHLRGRGVHTLPTLENVGPRPMAVHEPYAARASPLKARQGDTGWHRRRTAHRALRARPAHTSGGATRPGAWCWFAWRTCLRQRLAIDSVVSNSNSSSSVTTRKARGSWASGLR